MATGDVSVIFISHEHLYAGQVQVRGQRLLELLNDPNSDYLGMHEVQVCRASDMAHPVAEHGECVVCKATIQLALITSASHEAPQRRLYAYVPKPGYPVFLTVAGYEVTGNLHLSAAPDALTILTQHAGTFFPLTQAQVSHASWGSESLAAPVVLAQKASLGLFHIAPVPITVP